MPGCERVTFMHSWTFTKSDFALVSSALASSAGSVGEAPSLRVAVGAGDFVPTSAAAPEAGGTLGGIAVVAAGVEGGPWAQRFCCGAVCVLSGEDALVSQCTSQLPHHFQCGLLSEEPHE